MTKEIVHALNEINLSLYELIKALEYDRGQYEKGYADGRADRGAEIVRCEDCMYWDPATLSSGRCLRAFEITAYKDDFCSYGERKDEVEP